jgi:DNA (cytosine-5)-methyltransferase 1
MERMPMTFGSLFAGIGGFDLGLERAGMTCKWQVETDDYASRVLAKHWPDVPRHDDVRTFPTAARDWAVDVICGGFPCQDISIAGKGAGLAGARSGLWYEFARIIGELRPRYVIVENVAALLTRGMGTVLGDLSALGYDAEWHVVPASAVGAPHRRERVWIVAHAIGFSNAVRGNGSTREEGMDGRRLHAGGGQRNRGEGCARQAGQGACDVADAYHQGEPDVSFHDVTRSGVPKLAGGDGWWSAEPNVGRVAYGVPSRVDRLRCLGNAVVPQVVEVIGRAIIEAEAQMSAA